MDENKKSEEFYRKALKEYVNDGNEIRAAFVHLELGKIHLSNENNAESRNSLIQAYSGLKKTAHYEELAFIHKSLGLIDMYNGDLQKACDHWDKSIVLFKKTKNLSSTENQEIVQAMVPTLCAHL